MIAFQLSILVVCLSFSGFANGADSDQLPPARYVVKGEPRTGSMLSPTILRMPVALNRRYSELSSADLAVVKLPFAGMGANDEPPFPVAGLDRVITAIARACQRRQAHGVISAVATIDSRGMPVAVKMLDAPGPELTDYVSQVLLAERYKPAVCSGAPCQMDFAVMLIMQKM